MSRLRWGRMPSVTCESVNSPGELDRPGHRLSTKLSPRFSHGLIGEPLSTSRKPGLYATDCSRSASRSACSSSRGPQHDRRALPTPSGIEGFSTPPSSDPPACHDWRVKGKEALRPRARGSSSLRVPPFTRALTGRDISGERHDHSSLHCLLRHWDDRGSGATVLPRWRSRACRSHDPEPTSHLARIHDAGGRIYRDSPDQRRTTAEPARAARLRRGHELANFHRMCGIAEVESDDSVGVPGAVGPVPADLRVVDRPGSGWSSDLARQQAGQSSASKRKPDG